MLGGGEAIGEAKFSVDDDGVDSCITDLVPGTSIDIPAGTAFQYRNVSDQELKFICIAMPPWPGDSEATYLDGIWVGAGERAKRPNKALE